jgi:hypothetical protein
MQIRKKKEPLRTYGYNNNNGRAPEKVAASSLDVRPRLARRHGSQNVNFKMMVIKQEEEVTEKTTAQLSELLSIFDRMTALPHSHHQV